MERRVEDGVYFSVPRSETLLQGTWIRLLVVGYKDTLGFTDLYANKVMHSLGGADLEDSARSLANRGISSQLSKPLHVKLGL